MGKYQLVKMLNGVKTDNCIFPFETLVITQYYPNLEADDYYVQLIYLPHFQLYR